MFTKWTGIEKTGRMAFENHDVAGTIGPRESPLLGLSRMTPWSPSHGHAQSDEPVSHGHAQSDEPGNEDEEFFPSALPTLAE